MHDNVIVLMLCCVVVFVVVSSGDYTYEYSTMILLKYN